MASILIADDEPFQRYYLRDILSANPDLTINEATDGQQALQFIQDYLPDLVVLDLKMPVLDGLEICRQVKADPALRHIHLIIVSADPDAVTGRNAGGDAYLVKPYDPPELEAIVLKLLDMPGSK